LFLSVEFPQISVTVSQTTQNCINIDQLEKDVHIP
jgi:hypothetical protein